MPNKNKRRGDTLEYELRDVTKQRGLKAVRARGSDGRSLGRPQTVDLLVEGIGVQAKRRKKLPAYLAIPEGCEVVGFRQDRGPRLALMSWDFFLDLVDQARYGER